MTDLQQQRTEAESRIAGLRRKRGAAMLDGAGFDDIDVELHQAEAALAALDDSETEQTRRQRAAAADEWTKAREAARREAIDDDKARLAAVGKAERACRDLVASLNEITRLSRAEHGALQRLDKPVMRLGPHATSKRLSALMAPVLAGLEGYSKYYGDLQWHHVGRAARDWREAESSAVNIESILSKEK